MCDQVTSLLTGDTRLTPARWGALWPRPTLLSTVHQFAATLPDSESAVVVDAVRLKAVLCCKAGRDCEPCMQVIITIRGEGLAMNAVLTTIHLCLVVAFLLPLLHLFISIHCCFLASVSYLIDPWLEVCFLSGTNNPKQVLLEPSELNDEEELRTADGSGQAEPEVTGAKPGTGTVIVSIPK